MALGLILGGAAILGSSAAGSAGSSAAAEQSKKAAELQRLQTEMVMRGAMQNAAPYMLLGKRAAEGYKTALPSLTDVGQYREFTQPYGMEQYKQSPLYTPMVTNLAELQATPGYQFQLEQGQQAANMGAAARGGMLSGAQQQALQRFGQGLASTGFQGAWERAQNAYKSAFEANQARGRMLAGVNRQAADIYGQATGIGNAAQQGLTNAGVQLLQPMNQAQQQIGQANAVSAAAPYQGISSALSGLGNLAMMGAGRGLFEGTPSVNSPSIDDLSGLTAQKALTPNLQSLGSTPYSSQSIFGRY